MKILFHWLRVISWGKNRPATSCIKMTRNDQQTVTEKNLKGQLDRKAVSNKKGFAKKGSKNT